MPVKGKNIRFEDDLVERIREDREFAAYFLSEILNDHSPGHKERVVLALRRIAQAHGMTSLTKKIGRSPKALYVSLAKDGNPTLETFFALLDAFGIQLIAKARPARAPRRGDSA
jgi:probable addiction module antidote protein